VPRVERAWREASRGRRRLRALLDTFVRECSRCAQRGRVTCGNATAAALLRWGRPECVGLNANDLQALRDMRPGSASADGFLRADGSGLPLAWRCAELDVESRVLVFRDATERVRMPRERDILPRRCDPPRSLPAGHASGRVVFIHSDA